MKFKISPSYLLSALTKLSKAVPNNASLPILENILFNVTEDKRLHLTASDTELTIKAVLTLDECEKPGRAAVPARVLLGLLKEIPELPLEISVEDNLMIIEWFGGSSSIPVQNPDDYPIIPSVEGEGSLAFTIASDLLVKCLQKTYRATELNSVRPALEGVFFDLRPDGLTVVGTDARQMTIVSTDKVTSAEQHSFLLHRKSAAAICSAFEKQKSDVTVRYNEKYIEVLSDNITVLYRAIVGKFPNFRSVIPNEAKNGSVTLDREAFNGAIRRVGIFNNRISGLLVLEFDKEHLTISGNDYGFATAAKETVPCSYEGEPLRLGFKDEFLQLVLSAFDKKEVDIALSDERKPILISQKKTKEEDINIQGVLMPVTIPEG